MTNKDIRFHPLGFLEISHKPSKEDLRRSYAEREVQASRATDPGDYGPEEYTYIQNKLTQRAQLVSALTQGRVGSMLDVGCAEGFAMAYFQQHGWTVVGLDYSQAGVAAMNPQCMPALQTGDLDTLLQQEGRADRKFDLIWVSKVLERVLDPVSLLLQLRELLAEGGVLVLITPNDFSPTQRHLMQLGQLSEEDWVWPPGQLSYFDAASLRALAIATGYRCQHLIGDFPKDWFLYHPGSNYVRDRSLGPAAQRARVHVENFLAERSTQRVNNLYEAMADLGLGTDLTAFLTRSAKPLSAYVCLKRHQIAHQAYAIRTVEPGDIESIRQWRNAQMDVLRQQHAIACAEQIAYYEREIWPTLAELQPKNLLLAYLLNDQLIGYGGLVHIGWEHRRAEVSFLLDPVRTQDQLAYGEDFSIFLRLIKTLAFEDLGLHKLYTETFAIRTYHIKVLESAGFDLEGTLRQHVLLDDRPVDSLIHGCLKDTYAG